MFRRVFRITFKLGVIAAIGVGIAVVVKKLTAPPEIPASLEPWPPLSTESPVTSAAPAADEAVPVVETSNGEATGATEQAAPSSN
jgi:hypothetical protein